MKALKCDVCGGYFDGIETISGLTKSKKPNKLQVYYEAESGKKKYDLDVDICPDCYNAIKKAMDDRKKIHISDPNEDDLK